jgi:hypothetical protein
MFPDKFQDLVGSHRLWLCGVKKYANAGNLRKILNITKAVISSPTKFIMEKKRRCINMQEVF